MAIQVSYIDKSGTWHPTAYARVVAVHLDLQGSGATIDVALYHSQVERAGGFEPVSTQYFTATGVPFTAFFGIAVLDQPASNPVKQAYKYLKTLPGYELGSDA